MTANVGDAAKVRNDLFAVVSASEAIGWARATSAVAQLASDPAIRLMTGPQAVEYAAKMLHATQERRAGRESAKDQDINRQNAEGNR